MVSENWHLNASPVATLLQARDLCWQLLQQTCLEVCFPMSFTYLIIVPIPH